MTKLNNKIELLAPARDLEVGCAAINAGADAVYIGGELFSARNAAANPTADIAKLCNYAHRFGAKVFLAMNTTLDNEKELKQAEKLALQTIDAGIDAIIFQDPRVLDMKLPVELHASTQTAIRTPQRALELQQAGVKRIVLERNLSIDQIRAITSAVGVEIEAFVHGAICVGNSGVCYLSEHLCGRSGNRGECAQPCRSRYDLVDSQGEIVLRNQTLLNVKDLCLADRLQELLDAGVTSLKIEGRLKDQSYITNIVSHYNSILKGMKTERCSWGESRPVGFVPNPSHSFNRGFTEWFFDGAPKASQRASAAQEYVGTVTRVGQTFVEIKTSGVELQNGDGLCYLDDNGEAQGVRINRVEGKRLHLRGDRGLSVGMRLYRNHREKFSPQAVRTIPATITLSQSEKGEYLLFATTPQGIKAAIKTEGDIPLAQNTKRAKSMITEGLSKGGGTIFTIEQVRVECTAIPFLSSAQINALRREVLTRLEEECSLRMQRYRQSIDKEPFEYSSKGVTALANDSLMTTPYCILRENGLCLKNQRGFRPPFHLRNNGKEIALEFDCKNCTMRLKSI